ncbi:restriction endonuclease subunit S [Adlercreutzia equolifaciens]|uniref:restriction endonuclease subunit S n=1 Tax=Adlercreutzia equolifaciens TaxID=446660 RepID=UPI00241F8250|nr:restriction endonuclease subunit S [Adlercreutzia equolifaciens]
MDEQRKPEKALVPSLRFEGFNDPWEQRKLEEVATFGGGHTPSMADPCNYENGSIPWITSQDVKSQRLDKTTTLITDKGAAELNLYPVGSLVVVVRSGILRHTLPVAELQKPMTVNQDIRVIVPTEALSSHWLLGYLEGNSRNLLLKFGKVGTTVESINFSEMKSMGLMMPSREEQSRIGSLFAKLDSLIALHQRKHGKLKTVKQSLLEKMFPKEGEDVPEIRFEGFTEPWEQRKLGEFAALYKESIPTPSEGHYRLGVRSHGRGTFLEWVAPGKQIGETVMQKVKADNLVVNIVFAWEHAVAITSPSDEKALVSHRFPQYKFDHSVYPPFIGLLILDEVFRHHLWLSSPSGAGRNKTLRQDEMLEYKFLLPGLEEQRAVSSFFSKLDSLIALHQRELEILKNLKKAMLEKMFV